VIHDPAKDQLSHDVVAVIAAIGEALVRARTEPLPPRIEHTYEPCNVHHLDYERYVDTPRRAGRDPVYDSLIAEATRHHTQPQADTA
jgi:hypothetical protein